jgi:hypothetical protein
VAGLTAGRAVVFSGAAELVAEDAEAAIRLPEFVRKKSC